jgi:hypothetical protein
MGETWQEFMWRLSYVMKAVTNQDVRTRLHTLGATDKDIVEFLKASSKIASTFYGGRGPVGGNNPEQVAEH